MSRDPSRGEKISIRVDNFAGGSTRLFGFISVFWLYFNTCAYVLTISLERLTPL